MNACSMGWMGATIVAAVVTLSSCAGVQRREATEVSRYCAARYADPRLAPIRSRIPIPIALDAQQPVDLLADAARPTATEREALRALAQVRAACNDYATKRFGPPPAYRMRTQDEISLALARLYSGETTYGQFNRSLLYISERNQAAREELDRTAKQREAAEWMAVYD